jgi:tetratricopeptide (TPR) repeat protein
MMDSPMSAGMQAGLAAAPELRPVWVGSAPPLADGFTARQETGQLTQTMPDPGTALALIPEHAAGSRNWRDATGKTQLALSFAHSLWQAGAVDLVIWLTATSRAQVLSGYVEAAAALGIQLSGDAESVSERFLGWLHDTQRPWLVVIDDLTDALAAQGLWPAGPSGRVLITTSDPVTLTGYPAHIMPVGAFSRREALTYLVGRLTTDLDQRQGAIDLIGDLRNEPLALVLASAVIASSELTCHDYREHFLRRREQALGAAAVAVAEATAAPIAWALSVDHADLLSPGTAHSLLALAALLDGDGIPGTVFSTTAVHEHSGVRGGHAAPRKAVQDGLAALEQAGLMTTDTSTTPPTLRMNWLVQAAARAAMPEAMLKGAATAAADALLETWPADDEPEWLARSLRSCTETLRRYSGALLWEGGCHALLMRAGSSLDSARLTGPAVGYWQELATTSARLLGHDHPATVGINERLAQAYLAAGRSTESVELLEQLHGDRSRRAGPDHPGSVQAGRDLGFALLTAKRFDKAITVLTDVASGWERSAGAESVEAITAREDLAAAHRAAGQFDEAIALLKNTLRDRERIQGSRHPETTTACQKLAETYLAAGQAKAAISLFQRVVSDRGRVLGANHVQTIAARGALGSANYAAGKMAVAVRLYEQTRTEYARALGADHPDTLGACINLAHAYYAVGRLSDAARLLTETVERCELSLPPADPLTVTARTSLANISGDGNQR